VTEGREGVKFGRKRRDIFFEWPPTRLSSLFGFVTVVSLTYHPARVKCDKWALVCFGFDTIRYDTIEEINVVSSFYLFCFWLPVLD